MYDHLLSATNFARGVPVHCCVSYALVSNRLALMTAEEISRTATNTVNTSTSTSTAHQGRGKPAGSSSILSATQQQQKKKEKRQRGQQEQEQKEQQQGKEPQQKELDALYLVLDCIIDLGLGDRGLS